MQSFKLFHAWSLLVQLLHKKHVDGPVDVRRHKCERTVWKWTEQRDSLRVSTRHFVYRAELTVKASSFGLLPPFSVLLHLEVLSALDIQCKVLPF